MAFSNNIIIIIGGEVLDTLPQLLVVIEAIVGRSPENRDRGSIATGDSLHVDILHVHDLPCTRTCVSVHCMQCWLDQVSGCDNCSRIPKTID